MTHRELRMSLETDRAERRKRAAHARDYLEKFLKSERRELWNHLSTETTRLLKLLEGSMPAEPNMSQVYVLRDLLKIWER